MHWVRNSRVLWFLTVLVLATVASSPGSLLAFIAQSLALVGALTLAMRAALGSTGAVRGVWLSVSIAVGLMLAASAIDSIMGANAALADRGIGNSANLLFIASALAVLVASSLILKQSGASADRTSIIDAAIVITASTMLISQFVVVPQMTTSSSTPWPLYIAALIDLLIIGSVVRLWFSAAGRRERWVRWLSIGFLLTAVADLAHMTALANPATSGPLNTVLLGIGFIGFLICIGIAALTQRNDEIPMTDPLTSLTSRWRTLAMVSIALVTPTLVHLDDQHRGRPDQDSALFVPFTLVLAGLVLLRLWVLVSAYRQNLRSNAVLREITLESIDSRCELSARVSPWIASLSGDSTAQGALFNEGEPIPLAGQGYCEKFDTGERGTQLCVSLGHPMADDQRLNFETLARVIGSRLGRFRMKDDLVRQDSETLVGQLLANAADAVLIVDQQLQIKYHTPALERLTGVGPGLTLANSLLDLVPQHHQKKVFGLINEAESFGQGRTELPLRTQDDQYRIVDALAVWSANENHWVLTLHDVTEQHALRDQLMERAFYDPLTGLANRELFRDHLRTTLARKQRYGGEFAVIMIDLDDFKHVNDSLGHAAGDLLLSEVGRRLDLLLRDSDTAARLGGDEFAVIVDNLNSPEAALEVADRIIDWISAPFTVLGREIMPSASLGITLGADGRSADELERNADLALYRAKGEGRNRWALYHQALHQEAVERLNQVGELHVAVEQGQFEPWYQPIVDLETGAIAGVEALARWVHPTRGILAPGSFIPVAESSGLIVEIGRQLLRRSTDDLATVRQLYPDMASLRLSVNVSPRQMVDDRLVADIHDALESNHLESHSLILEITEGVLLPQEGVPLERLNQIHDLGVSLYIDDFGTGWSSLSYLRTLPVAGMKLAREFVVGLSDSDNVGLVTAIRDIAVNLQFDQTVAEGIETDEQRQQLIKHGYTLGQGYLLAKPMPFAELIAYLSTRPAVEWIHPKPKTQESVATPV